MPFWIPGVLEYGRAEGRCVEGSPNASIPLPVFLSSYKAPRTPWVPAAQSRGRSLVLQEYSLWWGGRWQSRKPCVLIKGSSQGPCWPSVCSGLHRWSSFLSWLLPTHPSKSGSWIYASDSGNVSPFCPDWGPSLGCACGFFFGTSFTLSIQLCPF